MRMGTVPSEIIAHRFHRKLQMINLSFFHFFSSLTESIRPIGKVPETNNSTSSLHGKHELGRSVSPAGKTMPSWLRDTFIGDSLNKRDKSPKRRESGRDADGVTPTGASISQATTQVGTWSSDALGMTPT